MKAFCILPVLAVTSVISALNTNVNHIRVFPALNQSVAGVFQVSHLNSFNQPQYAFNASEARGLCSALGVHIASKAQVETALTRGFETCRFGWIDEHFAVIPRIRALINCGQNQTGLVPWRAAVTRKFDVFCFNEIDALAQLEDTATVHPLNSSDQSPSANNTTSTSSFVVPSSSPDIIDEPARSVGGSQQHGGGKVILITCVCVILLIATIILAYLKLKRSSSNDKQQEEYIETEEWTIVTKGKETKKAVPKQIRIKEENTAQ